MIRVVTARRLTPASISIGERQDEPTPLVKELAINKPYHELVAIFDDAATVVSFIENNPPKKSNNRHWSFCSEHCPQA